MTQPQKNKIRLLCAMLLAISLPVIGMMYGMSGGFFDFILYQGLWFGLCLGCLSSAVCFWLLLRGLADWGKVKYFLWGYGFLYLILLCCFRMNFMAFHFCSNFGACHILLAGYITRAAAQSNKKNYTPTSMPSSPQTCSTGSATWRKFAILYAVAALGVLLFTLIRYGYDFAESYGVVALGVLISFLYDILGFFLLILSDIILLLSCCLRNVVGILVCAAFHIVYGVIYVGLFLLMHMLTPVTIGAILCLLFGIITYIYYFSLPKHQRDWRPVKIKNKNI